MPEIVLNESDHTYTVNGVTVPSVTTILRFVTADGFRGINPSVLDAAAARGSSVHAACEMIDYGGDFEIVPGIEGYLKAYNTFLRDYRPEWVGIESPVCSPSRGFAGTIDRWGFIDDSPAVVDIKTIASPNISTYTALCAQTAAYAYCLGYCEGCKRYGLFLKPDGDYRLFDCEAWEEAHDCTGFEIFAKCYAVHHQLEQIKKARKRDG